MTPADRALVRRLHAAEFAHLRDAVREMGERIEELERRCEYAEDCAERWREDALQAINDAGAIPGLDTEGRIHATF